MRFEVEEMEMKIEEEMRMERIYKERYMRINDRGRLSKGMRMDEVNMDEGMLEK